MEFIFKLDKLESIAKQILNTYPSFKKFALYGEMGCGKTTFVNAICKELGVIGGTSSPTYAILQEYSGVYLNETITICHMDWYRLKSEEDIYNTGLNDYLNKEDIFVFVEWPSIFPSLITIDFLSLQFSYVNELTRKLVIKEVC